jgi:transposase
MRTRSGPRLRGYHTSLNQEPPRVRITTAFNRLLALPGLRVMTVRFQDRGIVVEVRKRARLLRCPCGWTTTARYDRSRRRWRHLDLGVHQLWIEADIDRVDCQRCDRVRTEQVPWAREGARQTRPFEQLVGYLAQRMDRSAVATLLRCSWRTVTSVIGRLVNQHADDSQLDGLRRIGVDEIGYRRRRKFLTIVADHDTGRVVWVGKGKDSAALTSFFDALGPERCAQLESVSMDMGRAYTAATAARLPDAKICLDPFHLVKWTGEALERIFRSHALNREAKQFRKDRYLLRAAGENLSPEESTELGRLRRSHEHIGRAYDLKEGLRGLFSDTKPEQARAYLDGWLAEANTSDLPAFVQLARRVSKHYDGIVNAVELGLSNSRLEGINGKIRLINARGYGHHSAEALAAMIQLNLGGIRLELPTAT